MPRVYISGPMEGHPDLNFAAFNEAEKLLRDAGYQPINPARHGKGKTVAYYMRRAIHDVLAADGVAMLDGWETSKGANLERAIAKMVDLSVRPLADWLDLER